MSRTSSVTQKLMHFPHFAIFPATPAAASDRPRCWMSVAAIIAIMAVLNMPGALGYRQRQRSLGNESPAAPLARLTHDCVYRIAAFHGDGSRGYRRCYRDGEVLRNELSLGAALVSIARDINHSAFDMHPDHILIVSHLRYFPERENRGE